MFTMHDQFPYLQFTMTNQIIYNIYLFTMFMTIQIMIQFIFN